MSWATACDSEFTGVELLACGRYLGGSAEQILPTRRHAAGGAGHGLVQGMVMRRYERGAVRVLVGPVVPEPVLTWFEAADDRVLGCRGVSRGMPARRVVAAADVPTLGASA